ncbi:MAG: type II toxin-antitoxin system HipA family toxin [Proteobacteria bacterium]|nr:type II toxin-antitoxin system HipA family toxin [Pseudomonadota bacterium]
MTSKKAILNAKIILWGTTIGAVHWDETRELGVFEYATDFIGSGIEVAPIMMPVRTGVYDFPNLRNERFKGLPGLLADSLPDKYGSAMLDSWLVAQGRGGGRKPLNSVERLCYTGTRGMGALEFHPAKDQAGGNKSAEIPISPLVDLAADVVANRAGQSWQLAEPKNDLANLIRVGTSAGGARAKAVLAWNKDSGEFRSGQVPAPAGFTQWLIKLDGVSGNADKESADPADYGRLEYACALLAGDCGVRMSPCHLHTENGRAHFMTKRFDRGDDGQKYHMQSLGGLRHFDFNQSGAYSYEQAIETQRRLSLSADSAEQQVRRAFLNIIMRNQDDHVKNISYLMDKNGDWTLSPAYDVVYSFNPNGAWTSQHQMSLCGKRDGFDRDDLLRFGKYADLKTARIKGMIDDIMTAVGQWTVYTDKAGLSPERASRIKKGFRGDLG